MLTKTNEIGKIKTYQQMKYQKMKLTVVLSDELVAQVISVERSKTFDEKVIKALEEYVKKLTLPIVQNHTKQSPLEMALCAAKQRPLNTIFHLIDLFSKEEWELIDAGERKSLGKAFRKAVEEEGLAEYQGMTETRKAIYLRT